MISKLSIVVVRASIMRRLASVVSRIDTLDGVEEALDRLRRGEGARTVLAIDAELAGAPDLGAVSRA